MKMKKGSGMDWKGVGDARPGSGTSPEKGQGGGSVVSADWKGIPDSRPKSSTESDSVPISGGGGSGKM